MSSPLLIDDLSEHLGNLPDWYIQILEEREKSECEVCPDDWIELILEDFDGNPITGEPYFVFTEGTQGSAISSPSPASGPFTNGSGRTTPARLNLILGSDVVDVGYGAKTTVSLNLTDDRLGEFEPYDEQLYLIDTPVTYDGPLRVSGDVSSVMSDSYRYWLDVANAAKAGVPHEAILDMLAEVDTACRAALGIYADLSLTARNEVEGRLLMAMQGVPPNAHKLPGAQQIFRSVEDVFLSGIEGFPGALFVGPDGVPYQDEHASSHRNTSDADWQIFKEWAGVALLLDYFDQTAMHAEMAAHLEDLKERASKAIENMLSSAGSVIASPAYAQQRGGAGRGSRMSMRGTKTGRFPKQGKGSNKRAKAGSRNGYLAHSQANARRPVKSETTVKHKGLTAKFTQRFKDHMDPGHGAKGKRISGAHTATAFKNEIARSGGEYQRISTHPADGRIKKYMYRVPEKGTGKMRPWDLGNTKTTYDMPWEEFLKHNREAFKNAMINQKGNFQSRKWRGVSRNGLAMEGFVKQTGPNTFEPTSGWFVW